MEILNNPTFQTFLGAFLGWLFSLSSSNFKSRNSNSITIERKTIIENKYVKPNSKNTDTNAILVMSMAVVIFTIFGYVRFSKEIFNYVFLFNAFSYGFILSIYIFSLVLGQMSSSERFLSIIPVIIFIFTSLFFKLLEQNISTSVNLIQKSNLLTPFEFIKNLTSYGREFILFQLLSFFLNTLVSLFSLIYFMNYLSSINSRRTEYALIWKYIYNNTLISKKFYFSFSLLTFILIIIIQNKTF